MTEYYERALQVKQKAIERPDVLEAIVKDYEAVYEGKGKLEAWKRKFAQGDTRVIFRVGQLAGGLWLAHKVWWGKTDSVRWSLENECQLAEKYFDSGKRVPHFSMIVQHNRIGSILTEDITQGGRLKIYQDELAFVWMQPAEGKGGRVKVYVDFKHAHSSHSDYDYKYSSEEAVLAV